MLRTLSMFLAGAALVAACGSKTPPTGTAMSNHAGERPVDAAIRKVDFLNRTYHTSIGEGEGEDVTVKDGDFERPNDDDGNSQGFFHVSAPVYGDVDGDGVLDAIVITVDNGGGTGMFDVARLFTMKGGQAVEIATIGGGDRGDGGLRSVAIETGAVVVERYLSGDGDGACCPSKMTIERYRWTGQDLAIDAQATRTVANPDAER
jgi:hypothetical protein